MDFFSSLDFSRVWELLCYDPQSPIIFSGGLFFLLFLLFLPIYMMLRRTTLLRIMYVTLFSLFFYYKSSGVYVGLLVLAASSDFLIGSLLFKTADQKRKKLWVALSMCINLGVLAYFKYFNFLLDLSTNILQNVGDWWGIAELSAIEYTPMDIFLPVGISFYTFQTMSYIIDIYRGRIRPLNRWIDYLFYVSFFPQLVAGPIVRARDFIPQIYKKPLVTRSEFGEGLFLIISGLLKKAVISDYISLNFVDRIFDQPLLYHGVENLMGIYGYTLQIYCDFSGYSDMAIGIALLLGFRFNINFDAPYQSATITEFWRRWHISLSSWLKDYLYISLGGNRKGKFRTYLNLLITMLLGGLWHGAALRFVLWGAIHGTALAVHKFVMHLFPRAKAEGGDMKPLWRFLGVIFTFHLVAFSWVPFRAANMETVVQIFSQIIHDFQPQVFSQMLVGYPYVFLLMLLGYLAHFTPKKWDLGIRSVVSRSPFVLQAFYLLIAVFIVFQIKSAEVQPFIYFQF
ncbi:probable poly (beta-D-mannuronate) O-acetylase [Porphyromonas crevioricanis JCM 15906]|uniref:Alginate O-acetyltransferase n=2 Tax=Porphyromonas crevioricanis TaxID=393921 RepID=A0A2X4PMR8_9PORP|nr:MBOAT family O-acyltransferase [Porphyromonas crevioricanis]KGN93562.1 alginate O-acetyltransferase [Porphyromonas crevioricanis]SJZ87084.1 D-alanyl-lipoteichoic acid acyltransferase DltB, MBOAT superfamily [Porphyromonas crevioricanis]SQH73173.1 D-alanyl-lipoteichoic acid biosynthesis protein DltB [Porphyromonas crevioricanis]GAD04379.1 probable poly (beta-D-mannuronate) O-acetylase [Porphyromonas crevioricanis JCM 15906]GAD07802.1 probable poly(beta-D-mannuronate) O-acetylase [Porphyromon